MNKTLLFLLLSSTITLLSAKSVKPKVMRAQSNNHPQNYSHSSHARDTREEIFSSSAEASSQVTVLVSIEASSEITSEEPHDTARLSYLDNNRVQITENIARGQGEYLTTLLSMMQLKHDGKTLEKIQKNFENLIYLSHTDFLNKLEALT